MKILAAHQPEYMPSIALFRKLIRADTFVLADELQFSTNSTLNKGRILTADGPRWLTVPVLTRRKGVQHIKDIRIDNSQNWQKKHLRSLTLNYKFSPYFEYFIDFFEDLYKSDHLFLCGLNARIIEFICTKLRISTKIYYMSELDYKNQKGSLIENLLSATECTDYLITDWDNRKYIDESLNQRLKVISSRVPEYPKQFEGHYQDLSVIDLLFNRGPEAVVYLLHDF